MKKKTDHRKVWGAGFHAGAESVTPTPNSVVGLFCHETSTNPEMLKYGWKWNRQARVDRVVGDVAMLQFFSALDGYPTTIEPVAIKDLLAGGWVFYKTQEAWVKAASEASTRYWDGVRAERGWE